MGRDLDPGLALQAEPLLFQILPRTIKEADNNQEAQQCQNPPPPVSHICLESPTIGHGLTKANAQAGQSGNPRRTDPGP